MGKRGPEPHKPTEGQRQKVLMMTMAGTPHDDIARNIGITKPTLHRHYREQLDVGMDEANAKVAGKLFNLCMEGNLGAIVWWEKTRRGFKERFDVMTRKPEDFDEVAEHMSDEEASQRFQEFLDKRNGKAD